MQSNTVRAALPRETQVALIASAYAPRVVVRRMREELGGYLPDLGRDLCRDLYVAYREQRGELAAEEFKTGLGRLGVKW